MIRYLARPEDMIVIELFSVITASDVNKNADPERPA